MGLTKKEKKLEQEEFNSYIEHISNYLAECIALHYKFFKNNHSYSFKTLYNSNMSLFNLTEYEEQKFFEQIETKLQFKYGLIRANKSLEDEPLYLIDLKEGND